MLNALKCGNKRTALVWKKQYLRCFILDKKQLTTKCLVSLNSSLKFIEPIKILSLIPAILSYGKKNKF